MNMADITNVITCLGFRFAVCLICFWYINKQDTRHREETKQLADALNNNTVVMQQLVDKLGGAE